MLEAIWHHLSKTSSPQTVAIAGLLWGSSNDDDDDDNNICILKS